LRNSRQHPQSKTISQKPIAAGRTMAAQDCTQTARGERPDARQNFKQEATSSTTTPRFGGLHAKRFILGATAYTSYFEASTKFFRPGILRLLATHQSNFNIQ